MPEREQIVIDRFAADRYARSQGFRLGDITDDGVTVSVVVRAEHANFHGGTHGGVIFSLADCAFSLASNAYPETAVAIDAHMVFTAPSAPGGELVATATEVTRGRSLANYRVTVSDPDGRIVGLFTGTVMILG
ncbi:MAG: PaaI family thioesterase [Acidimicrobiales bacterium]